MNDIRYAKEITIKDKILSNDDIMLIASLVNDQLAENDLEHSFTLEFVDGTIITGSAIDIFSVDEFKRRCCKGISINYKSEKMKKSIYVHLHASLYTRFIDSAIVVSSTDKTWYDATINQFYSIVKDIKNQPRILKYAIPLLFGLSLVESILLTYGLSALLHIPENSTSYGLSIVITSLTVLINIWLFELLKKAYPSIELNFGPDHQNKSKKIRNVIYVAIPFIVDIILFILGQLGGVPKT